MEQRVKNEEEASEIGMSPVCSCLLVNCRAYNPTVRPVSVCCATAWRTQTLWSCKLQDWRPVKCQVRGVVTCGRTTCELNSNMLQSTAVGMGKTFSN